MYTLSSKLKDNNWTLVIPNYQHKYEINIFDNNEQYSKYDNTWIIFGEWRDNLALFNQKDPNIIIQCINKYNIYKKDDFIASSPNDSYLLQIKRNNQLMNKY